MGRNEICYGSTEVKPQSSKLEVKAEEKIFSVKDVEEHEVGVLKTCVEEVVDFTINEDVKDIKLNGWRALDDGDDVIIKLTLDSRFCDEGKAFDKRLRLESKD
ncbi:hypothetical protein Tco_0604485 [Tanacetum coccineum]